jgi:hypothetical protein
MQRKNIWIVFLFPVLILGTGFVLYSIGFHKGSLSRAPQDWGSYGSYLTSFVNLSNLCVAIYFSYLVYKYNNRKDEDAKKRETDFRNFQQATQNPVLSFRTIIDNAREKWEIVNVGNGAALNLHVCYKTDRNGDWIAPLVKCYSIGKGDTVTLDWFKHREDVIGVYYTDVFGDGFVSMVGNDISEARRYAEPFIDIIINANIYKKDFFDEMLRVPSKRINSVRKENAGTTSSSTTIESTKMD